VLDTTRVAAWLSKAGIAGDELVSILLVVWPPGSCPGFVNGFADSQDSTRAGDSGFRAVLPHSRP